MKPIDAFRLGPLAGGFPAKLTVPLRARCRRAVFSEADGAAARQASADDVPAKLIDAFANNDLRSAQIEQVPPTSAPDSVR
ncbi:hypothetical protein [Nocardia sp. NPDC049149]|uniref:hypothetical protein n=1 Tax=Nocardia sp. NPDC049149 TaxID=3364315 RepID=UPI0037202548